jgi:hypothetical protein
MPTLSNKHRKPLLAFLCVLPAVLDQGGAPHNVKKGFGESGVAPLDFSRMAGSTTCWSDTPREQAQIVMDALPGLTALSYNQGSVSDLDMTGAGISEGGRSRDGRALHQRRAVWVNNENTIRERVLEPAQIAREKQLKVDGKETKERARMVVKAAKEVKKAATAAKTFCYCEKPDDCNTYVICSGKKGSCPANGAVHKTCLEMAGEEEPEENEEFTVFIAGTSSLCKLCGHV